MKKRYQNESRKSFIKRINFAEHVVDMRLDPKNR